MKEKNKKDEQNLETKKEKKVKDKKEKKDLLKVLKKKEVWISAIVGAVIGALIILLLVIFGVLGNRNGTVATVKGGKVKENDLYVEMKKYYPISYVLELVDKEILTPKYDLTDEQLDEINTQADEILSTYELYYGYTEEEFLSENGFETKDDFLEYLQLDYRRNLYCIDYFKTLLSEEEIQNYYNDNVYGEISTKYMLVAISDDVTEENALATANEIITKLNAGTSFDDLEKEYEDKISSGEINFDNFNENSAPDEYVTTSKTLEKDKFTTTAVKTDSGYYIIYCTDKKDKPVLEEVENDIVEVLGQDLEEEDNYIRYKALIKLREDNNLKFKDSRYEEQYKKYCEQAGVSNEE